MLAHLVGSVALSSQPCVHAARRLSKAGFSRRACLRVCSALTSGQQQTPSRVSGSGSSRCHLKSGTRLPGFSFPQFRRLRKEYCRRFTLEVPLDGSADQQRVDAFVSSLLPFTSRAKVTAAIKEGLLVVNGRTVTKASYSVRGGDVMDIELPEPPPMQANPEDIPLDVVYEDDHVLVVNKPAGLVVHPSVGHEGGTLVNAVLHHCSLPTMTVATGSLPPIALVGGDTGEDDDDDEGASLRVVAAEAASSSGRATASASGAAPVLRPGIVHRIDKGTSGLLVVAKDERSHAGLCQQFAARSVQRLYEAILVGVPAPKAGRVEAPIGRDPKERKRMAVVWAPGANARPAASRYKLKSALANGAASLVEWKLETGRTHQIRVHAKHMGHSILGDAEYGGGGGAAAAALSGGGKLLSRDAADIILANLPKDRPLLHAQTLGFEHPITGKMLQFEVPPPEDFMKALAALQALDAPQP